jgi:hypothetical protein
MPNEPQSYGSQGEWVSGKTGQQVNRQKSEPPAGQAGFYEGRRDSESSAPHQGGDVSEVQSGDSAPLETRAIDGDETAVKGISVRETGAKRRSFFKDRDYGS